MQLYNDELDVVQHEFDRMGMHSDVHATTRGYGFRIAVNFNFTLCPTYPKFIVLPTAISDERVKLCAEFRSKSRLPVVTWLSSSSRNVLVSEVFFGVMTAL